MKIETAMQSKPLTTLPTPPRFDVNQDGAGRELDVQCSSRVNDAMFSIPYTIGTFTNS